MTMTITIFICEFSNELLTNSEHLNRKRILLKTVIFIGLLEDILNLIKANRLFI